MSKTAFISNNLHSIIVLQTIDLIDFEEIILQKKAKREYL